MTKRPSALARPAWSKSVLLDRAIQDLVRRWVGPSLLVVSHGACSSGAPSSPLEPLAPDLPAEGSGFDPIHCTSEAWDPMPHLQPAMEHDYAVLRSGSADSSSGFELMNLSETGARCAGASDADACSARLDTLPLARFAAECGQSGCLAYWVATSDGDEVVHWASREELLAFLGEIDSPEDALLLAKLEGYGLGHGVDSPPCTTAAVREVDDGYELFATKMTDLCPVEVTRYLLHVSRDGVVTVSSEAVASHENTCIGRRPEGLVVAHAARAQSELGAFFASSAHLEAAAVHAFDRMLEELRLHGAPQRLLAQAERARADEVRHAALVGRLAARFDAAVPEVEVEPMPPRSPLAIALENAVEGCVRETWGAVVGTYQAAHAQDPELAAVMRELAADERRHATLSFELAAWLDTRLSDAERAEVGAAFERAIEELRVQVRSPLPAALRALAGMPDAHTGAALFEALDTQLLH